MAIAADSAVTISGPNGTKILNSANKLFRLSKYHPVGLMLYNSASFMGTPWATILKMYRAQLEQESFDTLQEYCDNFIAYLRHQRFFTTPSISLDAVKEEMKNILGKLIPEKQQEEIFNPATTTARRLEILAKTQESIAKHIVELQAIPKAPDFVGWTRSEYDTEVQIKAVEVMQEVFFNNQFFLQLEFIEAIHELFHLHLSSTRVDNSYTGLIFCGFGNLELYPSLIPINISFTIGTKIHYYVEEKKKGEITYTSLGVIQTFAQKDVMDTILTGIDPDLEKMFLKNTFRFISKFNEEILKEIGDTDPDLRTRIENIDKRALVNSFIASNRQMKREFYINPLIGAIATLSKQDLAEMAESLIYLTYLKRRITFAEESVGGPVDVAIISKGDGFIWIKRKTYFEPKLNQHFFDNYYNT